MTQTIISPPPLGDKQDLPQETHEPPPRLTPRTPGNRRQDVTLALFICKVELLFHFRLLSIHL